MLNWTSDLIHKILKYSKIITKHLNLNFKVLKEKGEFIVNSK